MDQEKPTLEPKQSNGAETLLQNHNAESKEYHNGNEDEILQVNEDPEEDHGIRFKDWGFKVDRLFEVAYRFYKRNESKAFHPSFDIRNQMNALILQARYGNFDGGKAPDIGVLDLVGKNRRYQWSLLKGMSKTEAKSKFICTLDSICPFFKAYSEAVKISSETQPKMHFNDPIDTLGQSSQPESDEQLKAIRTSLYRQTYDQFKSYAEKQYPNDSPKQRYLITTLQEQYYKQYISQMYPEMSQGLSPGASPESAIICGEKSTDVQPNDTSQQEEQQQSQVSQASVPLFGTDQHPVCTSNHDMVEEMHPVEKQNYDSSSGTDSPLQQDITYEPLELATIWTKKGVVNEFKESLADDKQGGTFLVKQGTLLTIQVPTYPNGKYIYWEFATEDYDIGFGLDFVYETKLEQPLALKVYEETDEDEDDEFDELELNEVTCANPGDPEAAETIARTDATQRLLRRKAEKFSRTTNTVSIVPTYRRNSQEEVFVGRHRYPGQGYYLLKFDNTYSVLRSKSLFFRVCYFI